MTEHDGEESKSDCCGAPAEFVEVMEESVEPFGIVREACEGFCNEEEGERPSGEIRRVHPDEKSGSDEKIPEGSLNGWVDVDSDSGIGEVDVVHPFDTEIEGEEENSGEVPIGGWGESDAPEGEGENNKGEYPVWGDE